MKQIYLPVRQKFFLALFVSALYAGICTYICIPWYQDLSRCVGRIPAMLIIGGIAIVPGFVNVFLVISTQLDRQKYDHPLNPSIPVAVLIASYNEGDKIYNTLRYLNEQDYAGETTVYVADNNSSDQTRAEVERACRDFKQVAIRYLFVRKQGKNFALNEALKQVTTRYVITLDADTLLHKSALRYLIARIDAYDDVGAVAGAVMVKNSRVNLLTRMQDWDYFISMASIKKMQGLYQSTLVAQGAFSVYRTHLVRRFGGWADCIGEDIVLTWRFLENNCKVYYEPLAISFTDVPTKLTHFVRQRSRWARGMIEGFRTVKPWRQPNLYYKILTMLDIAIIYMDFSYTFFFIPGLLLALFGNHLIVGIMFLYVLPMTLLTFLILLGAQKKRVFDALGLKIRRNISGFIVFLLCYQFIMSPVSLWGYFEEWTHRDRVWK